MRCPDCGQEKDPEQFPRNRGTRSGRGTYCKDCHNARGRETTERLYGGYRHYRLKAKYGMGADQVDALIQAQRGVCPICHKRPAVHVDHDHATNKIRAILCEPCNGALGQFKDNVATIRNAIAYLETHATPGLARSESSVPIVKEERWSGAPAAGETSRQLILPGIGPSGLA